MVPLEHIEHIEVFCFALSELYHIKQEMSVSLAALLCSTHWPPLQQHSGEDRGSVFCQPPRTGRSNKALKACRNNTQSPRGRGSRSEKHFFPPSAESPALPEVELA